MKTTTVTLAGTLVVLAAMLGCPGPAKDKGDEPPRAQKAAPPKSIILEFETDHWESWGWGNARTITEVRAKPGDGIGNTTWRGSAVLTVVEIIDKDHVKVRVADDLVFKGPENYYRIANEEILGRHENLWIGTNSYDGGIDYTFRISDLDEVPVVKADDPKLIAAISAHANVTVDEVGSIQEIGPPGIVAPGRFGRERPGFDPGKSPTDEDMKNIGKLNNLRRLILTGSQVTDAGVVHLKGLDRLTCLDLSHTRVGDAGLRHLVGLKRLAINLSYTEVSDKSVKLLQNMKYPRGINLSCSKITREGFWQLLQTPPPWIVEGIVGVENGSYFWGKLEEPDGTILWPKQLAGAKSEEEKTVLRLLLLGCSLKAWTGGRITSATVTMTPPTDTFPAYHTREQALEVFRLLAKLKSVHRLKIRQPVVVSPSFLDDAEIAPIAGLRQVKYLDMTNCWLTEAGWMRLAGMSQLRELQLEYAKISDETVRKLEKALPDCNVMSSRTRR